MATDSGIALVSLNDGASGTNKAITEGVQRRLRSHKNKTWRTRNQVQEDQLQRDLERVTNDSSLRIPKLLQDYLRMKEKPGHAVVSSLVRYSILKFDSQLSRQAVDISYLQLSTHHTLGQVLEEFRRSLNTGKGELLRICAITNTTPKDVSKMYSSRILFFTRPHVLRRMYDAPLNLIRFLITQDWALDTITTLYDDESPIRHMPKLFSTTVFAATSRYRLRWVAHAPQFYSDFYEYIWQRQNKPPPYEIVTITAKVLDNGSKNLLIQFKFNIEWTTIMQATELFDFFTKSWTDKTVSYPLKDRIPRTVENEHIMIIFSTVNCVIISSTQFIDEMSDRLWDMTYIGRPNPSGSKLNYLTHLEDCRQASSLGLSSASTLLSKIISETQSNSTTDPGFLEWSKTTEGDIKNLQNELLAIKAKLEDVKAMLKEKLDLQQIRRTSILTILAAIFLPFSFMASLFGMNLLPLWSSESAPTVSSLDNSSPTTDATGFSQNETNSIISAIQSPNTQLWTFKKYWIITIPLTIATILFPLILGAIIRVIAQFAYSNRGYWRIIVLCTIFTITALIDLLRFKFIILIVFGICFGGPSVFMFARALYLNKHRLKWSGFFIMTVGSLIAALYYYNFATLLPLGYLGIFHWFRDDVKSFCVWLFRFFRRHPTAVAIDPTTAEEEGTLGESGTNLPQVTIDNRSQRTQ